MKDTLRLITTYKCNRNCKGCCNKQLRFRKDNIPVVGDMSKYNTVIITGGEPMLFPFEVSSLCRAIKSLYNPQIILYTAFILPVLEFEYFFDRLLDGLTLTLHTQADATILTDVEDALAYRFAGRQITRRLNIFKGVNLDIKNPQLWTIKDNMEWIPDCPVPENEDLKKLAVLF